VATALHNLFDSLREFELTGGRKAHLYWLPALEAAGLGNISRLPVCLRIVLESVLRNVDGARATEEHVRQLAGWNARSPAQEEIPFIVARILLQDFTGVPLLVDLAAMRDAMRGLGKDPKLVEPLVPVDLVVDHSVQVDFFGNTQAFQLNLELEFRRNRERYEFLKWGQHAFRTFKVVPPGIGIVHQVNLEHLAKGVLAQRDGDKVLVFPDTLVGTDSHTTMINGLGIVGWGVGGIEAEAGMLGQPVYLLMPEVVGVHMTGALREGVTATDLALHVTEMLRRARVVGKFVEFYGPGASSLPVADRATIANMAPEYGATIGFFPVDDESLNYMRATGRGDEQVVAFGNYFKAQQMFGIPRKGQIDYSVELELDLGSVQSCVAGPKRPQDRIALRDVKAKFIETLQKPLPEGYGKIADDQTPVPLQHGSVVIAAITSCTNTSNPSVMLAAGLLARKAVERGLKVPAHVKPSLAPGSRVVSDYLVRTGLQGYLDALGFNLVAYGCTTCIGNSGPLPGAVEEAIDRGDLVVASVLSGNRNFEARIHPKVKANFLMSPPLVVAFALAGRVDIDFATEPIGKDRDGRDVFLREIWPSGQEVRDVMRGAIRPEVFRQLYRNHTQQNPKWNAIRAATGALYDWDEHSTYIQKPPFFQDFTLESAPIVDIEGACALAIFGDSVTTDHISPAGNIRRDSPAGKFLIEQGVDPADFNSYGARRGNDRVMTRGTFANVRLRNLMTPEVEGWFTKYFPADNAGGSGGQVMAIYDAAQKYGQEDVPLIVFAGHEYGTGSSRDWAAKGTALLGVHAVVAQSFERIHRSNLVGVGVLPCQFPDGVSAQTLGLTGAETFDVTGLSDDLKPRQELTLVIYRPDGREERVPVTARLDTPIEVEYYRHAGILPYVLRKLAARG
jgi:aconitate hydratase